MQNQDPHKKYILVNNILKRNPYYKEKSTMSNPNQALAVVSSLDDIQEANDLYEQRLNKSMQLADTTAASVEHIQSDQYIEKFKVSKKENFENSSVIEGLTSEFTKVEVPLGLLTKVLALADYHINFIIDDSGSMQNSSGLTFTQAGERVRKTRSNNRSWSAMSRWHEVEDRLHTMIDMLAYLPVNISIRFLNHSQVIRLSHEGKTPSSYAEYAHKIIDAVFSRAPNGSTPLYEALENSLNSASDKTMHYIFTDGEPDSGPNAVIKLISERQSPQNNPINLISCTNGDEADWMKQVDETALFTAEIDDFKSEQQEVLHDQGAGFPFTKGFWLLCQLTAAINPNDLDAMDERDPFTKKTIDSLMGRKLSNLEYQEYFNKHPMCLKYKNLLKEFMREDIESHQIPGTFRYIELNKKIEYFRQKNVHTFSFWKLPSDEGGEPSSQPLNAAESKEEYNQVKVIDAAPPPYSSTP